MMRRRLFWKILFGFWATVLVMAQGMWLLFGFIGPLPSRELEIANRVGPVAIAATAAALREHPLSELKEVLSRWPASESARIYVTRIGRNVTGSERAAVERSGRFVSVARSIDNVSYRIEYLPRLDRSTIPMRIRPVPIQLIITGAIGGLFFSIALAWYLSRPIQLLRAGFDRIARGDLTTRLARVVGRRRDEIGDLGHDFDRMAEHLEALVAIRDRILHDVSHELRSPLSRLQLAVALAREDPTRIETFFGRIERDVARLDEIVGDLLTLARLESGEAMSDGYVDIRALIDTIVGDVSFEAIPRHIRDCGDSQAGADVNRPGFTGGHFQQAMQP